MKDSIADIMLACAAYANMSTLAWDVDHELCKQPAYLCDRPWR